MSACLAKRFSSVKSVRYFGLVQGSMAPSFRDLRLVGNHQVEIEVDGVAESLAARAGAVRIVEREQAAARAPRSACCSACTRSAAKSSRRCEGSLVTRNRLEDDFAGLAIADLDGVHDAGAGVWRDHQAVNQQEDGLVEVHVEQRFRSGEFEDLAVLIEAVEAPCAQVRRGGLQQVSAESVRIALRTGARSAKPCGRQRDGRDSSSSLAVLFGAGSWVRASVCNGNSTFRRVPSP